MLKKNGLKKLLSFAITSIMVLSLFQGLTLSGFAANNVIANNSLSALIGDLGQIRELYIKNNKPNNSDTAINFVLPNETSPQNGTNHWWMGEMIFSYRTAATKDGFTGNFTEVDTGATLAQGGSTTASNINSNNSYFKKDVSQINNGKVSVEINGQSQDGAAARAMKGFTASSEFNMDDGDDALTWSITLANKGDNYIELGDVGLPMPFNNKYANKDDTYNNRLTVHSYAGVDSGYYYAVRTSGEGNYILFTPVPETGARIEYVDHWHSNRNGISHYRTGSAYTNWTGDGGGWYPGLSVAYIHSKDIRTKTGASYLKSEDATSLILGPGESKTYQFKFWAVRAGDGLPGEDVASPQNASDSVEERERNMRSIIYNNGMIDAVAVPSFQTAINMPTKLDLHYDAGRITDVVVTIQNVVDNDPFDYDHIPRSSDTLTRNSRTGRGLPGPNQALGYSKSAVLADIVTDDRGEQHFIYNLAFDCLGNNSVRVDYKLDGEEKFTQYEFNVMAELDTTVDTHADFIVNTTQQTTTSNANYGIYYDGHMARDTYNNTAMSSPSWGDDWGHSHIDFMTMKNYLRPVQSEITSMEKYLIDFMWTKHMRNNNNGTGTTFTVANYASTGTGAGSGSRDYSEIMVVTGFFNMYRIMKAYPELTYRNTATYPATWYLTRAASIYNAAIGKGTIGFYGEQQIPDIIEALYAEGLTTEGNTLKNNFAYTKGRAMANPTNVYPYGSEFEYDNTGEEGAYSASKALRAYYPDDNRAASALNQMKLTNYKTRAMRGIQPNWFHYAGPVFRGGESWWIFQYTASLAGYITNDWLLTQDGVTEGATEWSDETRAWANRVNYGAKLSNFNAVNMGQISDRHVGAVSWRYTMDKGSFGAQNVNDGGTRVMNNGWNDFSGESDEGLYGSLLTISTDVVTDPIFGLFAYGGEISKSRGLYTVEPKDGFGKRINFITDRIYIALEQDQCTEAVVAESGNHFVFTLNNLTRTAHNSKISLRGMKDGSYDIKVGDASVGTLTVTNGTGVVNVPIPADATSVVTVSDGSPVGVYVPVSEISELPSSATVDVPLLLKGTVEPANAASTDIVWSIKDAGTTGAEINGNVFTATATGSAKITATVANGRLETGDPADSDYTQEFTITVQDHVPVTDITGVADTASVFTPLYLTGTVEPAGAAYKNIVWSVKDAGATGATISSGNRLNVRNAGIVKVTATVPKGAAGKADYTKDFTITVTRSNPPTVSAESSVKEFTATLRGTVTAGTIPSVTTMWTVIGRPANSNAVIDVSEHRTATMTVDAPGDYTVRFSANDGVDTVYKDITVTFEEIGGAGLLGVNVARSTMGSSVQAHRATPNAGAHANIINGNDTQVAVTANWNDWDNTGLRWVQISLPEKIWINAGEVAWGTDGTITADGTTGGGCGAATTSYFRYGDTPLANGAGSSNMNAGWTLMPDWPLTGDVPVNLTRYTAAAGQPAIYNRARWSEVETRYVQLAMNRTNNSGNGIGIQQIKIYALVPEVKTSEKAIAAIAGSDLAALLPQTTDVKFTTGSTHPISLSWNAAEAAAATSADNIGKTVELTAYNRYYDYTYKMLVSVVAAAGTVTGQVPLDVYTKINEPVTLPAYVRMTGSNGAQEDMPVVWENYSDIFSTSGDKTVNGTVTVPAAWGGGTYAASATVHIASYVDVNVICAAGGYVDGDIGNLPVGSAARLTAVAAPGFSFGGWYADSDYTDLISETNVYEFDVTESVTLYARFNAALQKQPAPAWLVAVAPTTVGGDDGKITGVNDTMEYRAEEDTGYSEITDTEITGLTAGKYYVRYKENAIYSASNDAVITVPESTVKADRDPPEGLEAVSCSEVGADDGIITGVDETMEYATSEDGEYIPCEDDTITGLAAGTYYVRYAETGTHNASPAVSVTVADPIPVVSVKINSAATTTVRKNKTLQLAPIFTPANANYGTEVTWASSNEASVKVDAETGLITGVKAGGSARITATTSNGKTYTITVTVDS